MVFQSYKSDYSNQNHQLIVSVSRHCYVTGEGKFKYQKKSFDVNLDKLNTKKSHVVHFLIRDHFSGLFYAELADSKNIISIFDFLYRAWSQKDFHPFCGIPGAISIPKNIQRMWPDIISFVENLGVGIIDVTSGFQGGVRDIRTWETALYTDRYKSGRPPDYSEVKERSSNTCIELATWNSRGPSKEQVWRDNLRE